MNMANKKINPIAAAIGAALLTASVVPIASADVNPFAASELKGGYQLADAHKQGEGKCGEGKCGGHKAEKEGKCGEGKCGGDKAAKDGSSGVDKAVKEGSCGGDKAAKEGKCGGDA